MENGDKTRIAKMVQKYLDDINPYGLLPDAPPDEFYLEAKMVTDQIEMGYDEAGIAQIMNDVLIQMLDYHLSEDSLNYYAEHVKQDLDNLIQKYGIQP